MASFETFRTSNPTTDSPYFDLDLSFDRTGSELLRNCDNAAIVQVAQLTSTASSLPWDLHEPKELGPGLGSTISTYLTDFNLTACQAPVSNAVNDGANNFDTESSQLAAIVTPNFAFSEPSPELSTGSNTSTFDAAAAPSSNGPDRSFTFSDLELSTASPPSPKSVPISQRQTKTRRGRRQRRVSDLPPHKLEHQRALARRASQRRRQRVLQQEAELEAAVAATDKRRQELEAERRVLAQELKILSDVLVCRHRARQAQPAS
eukprot:m.63220 g.63220  ORF g.63220 m.63220 type:complete len:262 (+) comp13959_c0_seq7:1140-1925(+)